MGVWGLGCPANGWGGVVEVGPCLLWPGVCLCGYSSGWAYCVRGEWILSPCPRFVLVSGLTAGE